MDSRADLVILALLAGGVYWLWNKSGVSNLIAAITPDISPASWTAATQAATESVLKPTAGYGTYPNQFTSGLADYTTQNTAGTVYAVFPSDPYVYTVDAQGTHRTPYTKQNMIDNSVAYIQNGGAIVSSDYYGSTQAP